MSALSTQANAAPSDAVVNACLRTESVASKVRYSPIDVVGFKIIEDGDMGKTVTTLDVGKDTVGTWDRKNPPTFGLTFNRKETPLSRVVRLKRDQPPEAFVPYEAVWGLAQDGRKSYICATFNFDGLGKSGSFQNVRGLYLIERSKREAPSFYTVGKISGSME